MSLTIQEKTRFDQPADEMPDSAKSFIDQGWSVFYFRVEGSELASGVEAWIPVTDGDDPELVSDAEAVALEAAKNAR